MRPRDYTIMARAVEEGVQIGWTRAHKHTERPDEDHIRETVINEVLNAITEVFEFQEGNDDHVEDFISSDDMFRD